MQIDISEKQFSIFSYKDILVSAFDKFKYSDLPDCVTVLSFLHVIPLNDYIHIKLLRELDSKIVLSATLKRKDENIFTLIEFNPDYYQKDIISCFSIKFSDYSCEDYHKLFSMISAAIEINLSNESTNYGIYTPTPTIAVNSAICKIWLEFSFKELIYFNRNI